MKIIITKTGQKEITELNKIQKEALENKKEKKEKEEIYEKVSQIRRELKKVKSKNLKTKKNNQNHMVFFEEEDVNPSYITEFRLINKMKTVIPKYISELYNNSANSISSNNTYAKYINDYISINIKNQDLSNNKSEININKPKSINFNKQPTSNKINSPNNNNSILTNLPNIKPTVSISQILNKKTKSNLKETSKKKDFFKKISHLKRTNNQQRGDFFSKSKERIDFLLSRKIPFEQKDIIKYLQGKASLSEEFIDKISRGDNEKMSVFNKIAQKTMINNEKYMKNKESLMEIMRNNKKKVSDETLKVMNRIDEISKIGEIKFNEFSFDYKKPMDVIIDKTLKYRRIWEKDGLDRFYN